jgi:hypothetical protein
MTLIAQLRKKGEPDTTVASVREQRLLDLRGRVEPEAILAWVKGPESVRRWFSSLAYQEVTRSGVPRMVKRASWAVGSNGPVRELCKSWLEEHCPHAQQDTRKVEVPCPSCRDAGNDRKGTNMVIFTESMTFGNVCGCSPAEIIVALRA